MKPAPINRFNEYLDTKGITSAQFANHLDAIQRKQLFEGYRQWMAEQQNPPQDSNRI